VYVNEEEVVSLSDMTLIAEVNFGKAGVATASVVVNDQRAIRVRGVIPGSVKVHLKNVDGKQETIEVTVRHQIAAPLDVPIVWQYPDKRTIKKCVAENDKIARFEVNQNSTALLVTPLTAGECRVQVTDADGKVDNIDLLVRKPDRLVAVGETVELKPTGLKAIACAEVRHRRIISGWPTGGRNLEVSVFTSKSEPNAVFGAHQGMVTAMNATGEAIGLTRVIFFDRDNRTETFWIGVKPKR